MSRCFGLDLELQQATGADYFAERAQGNFIMNIGLEVGGTDADTYLYHRFPLRVRRSNRVGFSDAALMRSSRSSGPPLDTEARAEAVKEASLAINRALAAGVHGFARLLSDLPQAT